MARCLIRQSDGTFRGATGTMVRLEIRSDRPASTVRLFYAGDEDGEPPFEIRIRPGRNKLLVAALGAEDGQRLRVVEVDGAVDAHLKNFFWSSTHFHTTLDIEGV